MSEPILDRDGDWECRITIRRNGVTVGWVDFLISSYDDMAHTASTLLQTREITYSARYRDEEDRRG